MVEASNPATIKHFLARLINLEKKCIELRSVASLQLHKDNLVVINPRNSITSSNNNNVPSTSSNPASVATLVDPNDAKLKTSDSRRLTLSERKQVFEQLAKINLSAISSKFSTKKNK